MPAHKGLNHRNLKFDIPMFKTVVRASMNWMDTKHVLRIVCINSGNCSLPHTTKKLLCEGSRQVLDEEKPSNHN